MINKTTSLLITASLLLAVFGLSGRQALAQNDITMTAVPPRLGEDFSLSGNPGDVIQATIKVANNSEAALPVKTTVEDFIVDDNGTTPIPVDDEISSRWSLASWLTITPEDHVIQPGQATTINLVINVPADALPGGHYAMVMHEPNLTVGQGETQSKVGQRVGTLIYFLVEGPINEEAFIRNFAFPQFTEYGPVPFSFVIENLSDIHISPAIKIEIANIFGQTVETITMEQKNVFPFVPREMSGQWDRSLGSGLYKSTLTMSFGQSGNLVVTHTYFWLLPIKIVALVALSALVILIILLIIRNAIVKRKSADRKRIQALEEELQRRNLQ
jgi:hypothetical protein